MSGISEIKFNSTENSIIFIEFYIFSGWRVINED